MEKESEACPPVINRRLSSLCEVKEPELNICIDHHDSEMEGYLLEVDVVALPNLGQ